MFSGLTSRCAIGGDCAWRWASASGRHRAADVDGAGSCTRRGAGRRQPPSRNSSSRYTVSGARSDRQKPTRLTTFGWRQRLHQRHLRRDQRASMRVAPSKAALRDVPRSPGRARGRARSSPPGRGAPSWLHPPAAWKQRGGRRSSRTRRSVLSTSFLGALPSGVREPPSMAVGNCGGAPRQEERPPSRLDSRPATRDPGRSRRRRRRDRCAWHAGPVGRRRRRRQPRGRDRGFARSTGDIALPRRTGRPQQNGGEKDIKDLNKKIQELVGGRSSTRASRRPRSGPRLRQDDAEDSSCRWRCTRPSPNTDAPST